MRKARRKNGTSLSDQAYNRLEEDIVTLKLAPGEVLSEAALSESMNIGRTPIREALQRLAREGLVLILPRKGILVSELNPGKQLLLLEVRRELERLLARTGALRASDAERQQLRDIADGMDKAAKSKDDIEFMRLDLMMNELVAEAAHNEFTNRAIDLMHGLARRFWYSHYKEAADLPLMARLHANMARQIAAGDADKAGKASDELIDYVESFTRATVNR
jgi:DNA-binding GntR family transcriptional regulator